MKRTILALVAMSLLVVLIPTQAEAQQVRTRSDQPALVRPVPTKPTNDAPADASAGRIRQPIYIGLGDSFASGEGNNTGNYDPATDTATNTCHRSNDSYSSIIGGPTSWFLGMEFVACSGAKIENIDTLGQNGEPRQLDIFTTAANTSAPRIITMSIGGNDAQFVPTLSACAGATDCHLDPAVTGPVDAAIAAMRVQLEQLYTSILTQPENADTFSALVVVGYPHLFGSGTCPTSPLDLNVLFSPAERVWMDSRADALNAEILAAVNNVASTGLRVHYANMVPVFDGHEACGVDVTADPTTQWINALDLAEFEHSFHPNEYGHAEMATTINKVITAEVLRYV